MPANYGVDLRLSLTEAEALHTLLEDLLEGGQDDPHLEPVSRPPAWRIPAANGGTALTGRMAGLARDAKDLAEYETARDRALGPVLEGLERGENRDP